MDIRGNEALREMLAAEYALGTLRGGARRRFERWARTDRELHALAVAWGERLAPLYDGLRPVAPPQRVWDAIEARLPGFAAHRAARDAAPVGWWGRLGLWRGLTAAFATAAVVATVFALRPQPVGPTMIVQAPPTIIQAPPQVVEGPSKIIQAPPTVVQAPPTVIRTPPTVVEAPPETRTVEVETMPVAVATLVEPKSGTPVAVVLESKDRMLTIKVAAEIPVGPGKALQLWMAPNDATRLESLGLLPAAVQGTPTRVSNVEPGTLARAKAFGLSLEPVEGSPQPTHVLGLGALVRLSE